MENYGNGVHRLNILQDIENISNKTIKRYKYSYSTKSKVCCKWSDKKWSKNTSCFISTDCLFFTRIEQLSCQAN